jgi:hypothetical protein
MVREIQNAASGNGHATNLEEAVLQRYGDTAQVEACLCLPVSYDKALLNVIPDRSLKRLRLRRSVALYRRRRNVLDRFRQRQGLLHYCADRRRKPK